MFSSVLLLNKASDLTEIFIKLTVQLDLSLVDLVDLDSPQSLLQNFKKNRKSCKSVNLNENEIIWDHFYIES